MNKNFAATLISVGLMFVSGISSADNGKPDLWKVEKNGNTSYLFGSIHLGSDDMYPLSKSVKDAYQSSDNLVVEIDMKPGDEEKLAPLVQQYGLNMSVPLENRLSPETLTIYKKVCIEKSLPCAQFAPFEAWLLSAQLSVSLMQQLGFSDALGIDKHFLEMAHKANKNVISLETADFQLKALSGFNQQQQELMLVQSLQATNEDVFELFKAWKSGDDATLVKMFSKDLDKQGAMGIYKTLFTDRNLAMAEKVKTEMESNKSLFVVVGAGHVVGETGLVNSLKKTGHKLTQIQ